MAKKPNNSKKPAAKKQSKPASKKQPKAEVTTKKVDGVVKIGQKPLMTYAHTAVISLIQLEKVKLQARGRNISIAADVSQVLIHRMAPLLQGKVAKIDSIVLTTEEIPSKGKSQPTRVSAIDITLIC